MGRRRVHAAAATAIALAMGTVSPAMAGGGITTTWPGPTCLGTLQQCIDNVQAESKVLIRTDGAVHESIAIDKSLTLRGDTGFSPILDELEIDTAGATLKIVIADLRVRDVIAANVHAGSGHEITIRRVRVRQPAVNPPGHHGVEISVSVPAVFLITGSRIHVEADQGQGIELNAYPPSGTVTLRAIANHIDQEGNPDGGSGIDVSASGAGAVRADLLNNVIRRVGGSLGGGIRIGVHETVDAEVNVVGNTVEGSRGYGLGLRNDVTAGGSLRLGVFGNVFAFSRGAGIVFDPGGLGLTFDAGRNAYYRNAQADFVEGRSLGGGNVRTDPRFVDRAAGDYRLRADSPLIDRAAVCSPGGIANPDAAGRHRLAGLSVDIGAYERRAPRVTGIVHAGGPGIDQVIGTSGRDIMCGYGSNDVLFGKGGPDHIEGGAVGDYIHGGSGRDQLFGGPGDDIVCGDDGAPEDLVDGGTGTDWFDADRGDVRVSVETRLRPCQD